MNPLNLDESINLGNFGRFFPDSLDFSDNFMPDIIPNLSNCNKLFTDLNVDKGPSIDFPPSKSNSNSSEAHDSIFNTSDQSKQKDEQTESIESQEQNFNTFLMNLKYKSQISLNAQEQTEEKKQEPKANEFINSLQYEPELVLPKANSNEKEIEPLQPEFPENNPLKKKRMRRTFGDQNTRERADNIRTRIIVFLANSIVSFLNSITTKYERYPGELMIRKFNRKEFGGSARKSKKHLVSFNSQINKTLADILKFRVAENYKHISKYENLHVYEEFKKRCKDDDNLIRTIERTTIKEFYEKVFMKGTNILDISDDDYEKRYSPQVMTFKKILDQKLFKKQKTFSFDRNNYSQRIEEYATKSFFSYYN